MDSAEPFFKRIAIIGLGLIGGSWALALKSAGYAARRTGFDRPEVLSRALQSGVVDEGAEDLASAVREADLVILATPVRAILESLGQLNAHVPSQALITDVGSTKRLIMRRASDTLGSTKLFLGGHPLAGKERSGFEHADAGIFKGAGYALVPATAEQMEDARVRAFVRLVELIGAGPCVIDASTHDRAVAYLSHLPQLLSSGLASMVADAVNDGHLPLELAGPGFRDVTRLAESPYPLWRDICLTNIKNIQAALEAMVEKLEEMKSHLSSRGLEREFLQAQKLRERLHEQR